MTTIFVDDILEYRCPNFGLVWQWRVLSICCGAERQESLIEIRPITTSPGYGTGDKRMETVWVPEPMTRNLSVVRSGTFLQVQK